jgi:membrane-bound inhibitor of C-type lysozyme
MKQRRLARTLIALGLALALPLTGARAATPASPLRDIEMQSRHTYRYTCANGKTFKVTYLGAANGQSFALMPVSGRTMLLVATIAGSGVRYQGDRYTWWTKGPRADLYDATAGDDAKPLMAGCATIMR